MKLEYKFSQTLTFSKNVRIKDPICPKTILLTIYATHLHQKYCDFHVVMRLLKPTLNGLIN